MTKTTSFIKQILNLPHNELLNHGFLDSYLGYYNQTELTWGKYIYLAFDLAKLDPDYRIKLLKHPDFNTIYMEGDVLLFEFNISEEDFISIINPFLNGQYSKICRKYVQENFKMMVYNPASKKVEMSNNYKVFNKHKSLAQYWEKRIGVTFTEDMEVWSRPEKEDEIYGYPKSDSELAPEAGSVSNTGC